MARQSIASPDQKVLCAMREKFPRTPDQLIPMLQFVQGELGYLSEESMFGIADYLKVPASHVYGVATFYAQFRFKPLGKNRITCCRGTACHVRGGKKVLDEISKELGIEDGGTTDDLSFSLETVACIGSCALAPVLVINQKVYGKMTPKRIKQVLDELRGITPATDEDKASEEKTAKAAETKPAPAPPPKKEDPKPAEPEKAVASKPAAAKKAGRPKARKAVKKKAAKKTAKKAVKKAVKKAAKPAAKKAAPKPVKKAAKKPVKKVTKKPAKKAVKKAVKKPAKKVAKKTTKAAKPRAAAKKKPAKKGGKKSK